MALKHILTAEEHGELAEALQEHYIEDGDGFRLDTSDAHPDLATHESRATDARERLKEFRQTNIDLRKRIESMEAEAEKAKAGADSSNEARLKRLEEKWQTSEAEKAKLQQQVETDRLNRRMRRAAKAGGISDVALDDAVMHLRTQRGMRLDSDGKTVAAEDGTTLDEAIGAMRKEQPFFFGRSAGGGSPPGGPSPRPAATVKAGSWLANEQDIIDGKVVGE